MACAPPEYLSQPADFPAIFVKDRVKGVNLWTSRSRVASASHSLALSLETVFRTRYKLYSVASARIAGGSADVYGGEADAHAAADLHVREPQLVHAVRAHEARVRQRHCTRQRAPLRVRRHTASQLHSYKATKLRLSCSIPIPFPVSRCPSTRRDELRHEMRHEALTE